MAGYRVNFSLLIKSAFLTLFTITVKRLDVQSYSLEAENMSLFAQFGFCTHGSMHFCLMDFQCVRASKWTEMEIHLVSQRIPINLIDVF